MTPSQNTPIADFYAVPLFNPTPTPTGQDFQAARAAYQVAHGGQQAPPFNTAAAVQLFDSPGTAPVPCFDPNNVAGGYVTELTIATPANIPGNYDYPPYVVAPTVAVWQADYSSMMEPVPANYITDYENTLAMVALLKLCPQLSGQAFTLDELPELPNINWGTETRRFWHITINGQKYNAAQLFGSTAATYGVGYPGRFNFSVEPGNQTNIPQLWWQNGTPATGPTGAYVTVLIPIKPIPAGYSIQLINRTPFSPGQFVVAPTPNTPASQASVLAVEIANMQAELAALQKQVG